MKLAHIRHTLVNALNDFRGEGANATHVLSAIEALIEEKIAPTTKNQDIPDLIAGALGVSRGTAYDLMREALAELARADEREACAALADKLEWSDNKGVASAIRAKGGK